MDNEARPPAFTSRQPIRVLVVEDVEDEMLLIARELRRAGYDPTLERVETAEGMAAALDRGPWDVIIADYSLPHFSGPAALAMVKERDLDLPFIIVSGAIGEETAVASMRAGAHDYVMKGNLRRLVPAIQRELREAAERRGRREAERALASERDYSRLLIERAPVMIASVDPGGRVTGWNPAAEAVTGRTRAAMLGAAWFDAVIDRHRHPEAWAWWQSVAAHPAPPLQHEASITTATGEERIVTWRASVLREAAQTIATIWFGIDVTEARRAEERRAAIEQQARRADKLAALGTLAAGLAHELNNPIGIISSRIELMLMDDAEAQVLPASVREDLEVLHRQSQRIARITQGLLSSARQSSGPPADVDLNRIVEEVLLLAGPQIRKGGVTIRTALDPALPAMHGSGGALQQVVLNLITNARDAIEPPGEIRIETQACAASERRQIRLVVEDTGCGMTRGEIEKIFEPFFTTKPEGTGLGLAIAQSIVREHKGTIEVESEPGRGTRFTLTFPA